MTSTQRPTTRRRSARLAFEDEAEEILAAPVVKKSRTSKVDTSDGEGRRNGNGVSGGAGGKKDVGRGTRESAYEEEDDGFTFSRARSKRKAATKPAPDIAPVPEESVAPPAPAPAPKARGRTKKAAVVETESTQAVPEPVKPKRRSLRLSGEKEQLAQPLDNEPHAAQKANRRPRKDAPSKSPERAQRHSRQPSVQDERRPPAPAPGSPPISTGEIRVAKKRTPAPTRTFSDERTMRVPLPFADTPVAVRNKEMRKGSGGGSRRSSTGMRGRRASSLIESGTSNAIPHTEVPPEEFYKHISQDILEPRRMKQLLIWCGTRALVPKPQGDIPGRDASAVMAARTIQEELLQDFGSKGEFSDWFSREEEKGAAEEVSVGMRKPNPRNVENRGRLEELRGQIERLQEEKKAWQELLARSKSIPPLMPEKADTAGKDVEGSGADDAAVRIDTTLLDPSQAALLPILNPTQPLISSTDKQTAMTQTTTSLTLNRLNTLTQSLEFDIDAFTHGVHTLQQYRNTAERVADRVLAGAAERLEERERSSNSGGRAAVGDVLRALGGVMNQ